MSNSYLSTLICRQAKKYGDRIALKYRDYETESWISVSWNQFAEKVNWVSNALIALGAEVQENIGVFFSEYAGMLVYGFLVRSEVGLLPFHYTLRVRKHRYTIYCRMLESVFYLWENNTSMT